MAMLERKIELFSGHTFNEFKFGSPKMNKQGREGGSTQHTILQSDSRQSCEEVITSNY